jgi:PhzF family phenazine biosynthesis protein
MELIIYQVDAFTSRVFEGNPAAVCPLEEWLDDKLMQSIAMENNLAETAFFVPGETGYHIRWFTPVAEVDLCGHATLASACIILNRIEPSLQEVTFASRGGPLTVSRHGDLLAMDFPSQPPAECPAPPELAAALGKDPVEVLASEDFFAVFSCEEDILGLNPDMRALSELSLRGTIVTAPGKQADFVSRFFAPSYGIDEDPVTGSAHCALTPYWARKLGKDELHAYQLSRRGGELFCEDRGDRVLISGRAVLYLEGSITV